MTPDLKHRAAITDFSTASTHPASLPGVTATGADGEVARIGGLHVVRLTGNHPELLRIEGVVCENPTAPDEQRTYRKEFHHKKIFLPDEFELARRTVLGGENVLVIGGTGYSRIGEPLCREYGISEEAYVAAYSDILGSAIRALQKRYPGICIKLVDGASDLGVDRGTIRVADHLSLAHLGFSCPKYLFHVQDNDKPVYVAASNTKYGEAFTRSLDILLSTGGRLQSLEHDISAAIRFRKKLVPIDIIGLMSKSGSPSAYDAEGQVMNATRAFLEAVLMVSETAAGRVEDFDAIKQRVSAGLVQIAGRILPHEIVYGGWKT